MNRENKRKLLTKGYFKNHSCTEGFTCKVCGYPVNPPMYGEHHRNHCSNCLSSLHLDNEPGDRESNCGGIMDPIIHRCRRCGHLSSNHAAPDDNPLKLISIAMHPIACPPFPIERIDEILKSM